MARLRMMRAPQKYVQGKDSLLHFHEEMKDLGGQMAVHLFQQRPQDVPRQDREEL